MVMKRLRHWWYINRAKKYVAGRCPSCGEILRADEHGRDVPPNPLDGSEHRAGFHFRCPNRHKPGMRHTEGHRDLRPWDLTDVSETEIVEHVENRLRRN